MQDQPGNPIIQLDHEPPPLDPESLLPFALDNCQHCTDSQLTWPRIPPRPKCLALCDLIHAAATDRPISLESRMFLYLDIDQALSSAGSILPILCPHQKCEEGYLSL